jgi:hypothetical protein
MVPLFVTLAFAFNCSDFSLNIFLTVRQKENFIQYFTWGRVSYSLQNMVFCFCRPRSHKQPSVGWMSIAAATNWPA